MKDLSLCKNHGQLSGLQQGLTLSHDRAAGLVSALAQRSCLGPLSCTPAQLGLWFHVLSRHGGLGDTKGMSLDATSAVFY